METAVVLDAYSAGFGVIRALGSQGVPVKVGYYNSEDLERNSKYVREKIYLPDPNNFEQKYIDCLLKESKLSPGSLLMPTSDAVLSAISRNKPKLEKKYKVACPDWEITQKFLDKKNTSEVAERAGVPAPKTFLPRSRADIQAWAPLLQFPCLAKPSMVHNFNRIFKKKMFWVENISELDQVFLEVESYGIELMIQEYIPGDDTLGANYNAYYWEGRPLIEFTAQKIRNAPPLMGSPCVLISKKIPEIMATGQRLLGSVGYSGFACTEWKFDPRDKVYKLMEVNPRHNMSSILAVRCGLNFPWIEYQHLMNGIVPQPNNFEIGIYWIDFFRDIEARLKNLGKEELTLAEFLRPYFHKKVHAFFDHQDPRPFILRIQNAARKSLHLKS